MLYEEIVRHAASLDPTGIPTDGLPVDPDDARQALTRIGERRAAGERIRAEAMLDLARWAPAAQAAGVSVAEIARLAGVTRVTVYATLARD